MGFLIKILLKYYYNNSLLMLKRLSAYWPEVWYCPWSSYWYTNGCGNTVDSSINDLYPNKADSTESIFASRDELRSSLTALSSSIAKLNNGTLKLAHGMGNNTRRGNNSILVRKSLCRYISFVLYDNCKFFWVELL